MSTNDTKTGSGKGPRFSWDNSADLIMLVALCGTTKLSSTEFEIAAQALAAQGFLTSDGSPVKGGALGQHYNKLKDRVSKLVADSAITTTSSDLAAGPAPVVAGPVVPAKRGRGRPPKSASAGPSTTTSTRGRKKTGGLTLASSRLSTATVTAADDENEDEDDGDVLVVETSPASLAKRRKVSRTEETAEDNE